MCDSSLGFSQQDDVGALVDDDLYERDILIAAKRLDCSPVLEERIQGNRSSTEVGLELICKDAQ